MDKNETQEKLGAGPLKELLIKVGGWSVSPSNFSLDNWKFQTQLQFLHNEINMGGFFTWAGDKKKSGDFTFNSINNTVN